jgi:hypothetical protein
VLFKQEMAGLQNVLENEKRALEDSKEVLLGIPGPPGYLILDILPRIENTRAQLDRVTSLHDQVVAETANLRREIASKCSGTATSAGNSGPAVSAGNSGTVTSAGNSGMAPAAANCADVAAQLANLYSQRSEFGASLKNTENQLARLSQPASEESVRTHISNLNKDVGDLTRWGRRLDREISQLEDLSNRWSCKRTAATTAAPPNLHPRYPSPRNRHRRHGKHRGHVVDRGDVERQCRSSRQPKSADGRDPSRESSKLGGGHTAGQ